MRPYGEQAAAPPEVSKGQAIAGYENRFERSERDLLVLKWMVGVITAGIGLIVGLLLALLRANP